VSLPWQVPFKPETEFNVHTRPRFLNWEKSFVSGPDSPLYEITHWKSPESPDWLLSKVGFKARAEGPPGHVHGGASAGLLDEVMGVLAWDREHACVTRSLQIHYARAIPIGLPAKVLTRLVEVDSRSLELHSTVYNTEGLPYVSCQGIFHILTATQLARFKTGI
jgi:acyl-coenzyme A thioesterase PaaI-like protein